MESNWLFSWCRPFFVWENNMLRELLEDLEGFRGHMKKMFGSGGWNLCIRI